MPPFPRHGVGADDDPAIDGETTANAGTKNDREDRRTPGCSAVRGLRQREAIRVVGQPHFPRERRGKVPAERTANEPRRVRVLHQTRSRRDCARHPDADRRWSHLCLRIGDERANRLHCAFVASPRRWHTTTQDLPTAAIDGDDLELRAADVDSNPHAPSTDS